MFSMKLGTIISKRPPRKNQKSSGKTVDEARHFFSSDRSLLMVASAQSPGGTSDKITCPTSLSFTAHWSGPPRHHSQNQRKTQPCSQDVESHNATPRTLGLSGQGMTKEYKKCCPWQLDEMFRVWNGQLWKQHFVAHAHARTHARARTRTHTHTHTHTHSC